MKQALDAIDELRYTTQPLPRLCPPLPGETTGSYLHRLASANLMDPEDLRIVVAGDHRKAAPPRVSVLSRLSGYPEHTLRLALPDLTPPGPAAPLWRRFPWPVGPGCRLCNATRGATDHALVRCAPEDVLCLRHCRWTTGDHQPGLAGQSEILAAHRAYRRMARAHGRDAVESAYRSAMWILDEWQDSGSYKYTEDDSFRRRISTFLGPEWAIRRNSPTAAAARYPQVVALTRLLASPYWAGLAISDHIAAGRPDPQQRKLVAARLFEYRRTASVGWRLPDPLTPDDFILALAASYLRDDGPRLRVFLAELRRTVEPRYEWFPYPKNFVWGALKGEDPSDPLVRVIIRRIEERTASPARPAEEPPAARDEQAGRPS